MDIRDGEQDFQKRRQNLIAYLRRNEVSDVRDFADERLKVVPAPPVTEDVLARLNSPPYRPGLQSPQRRPPVRGPLLSPRDIVSPPAILSPPQIQLPDIPFPGATIVKRTPGLRASLVIASLVVVVTAKETLPRIPTHAEQLISSLAGEVADLKQQLVAQQVQQQAAAQPQPHLHPQRNPQPSSADPKPGIFGWLSSFFTTTSNHPSKDDDIASDTFVTATEMSLSQHVDPVVEYEHYQQQQQQHQQPHRPVPTLSISDSDITCEGQQMRESTPVAPAYHSSPPLEIEVTDIDDDDETVEIIMQSPDAESPPTRVSSKSPTVVIVQPSASSMYGEETSQPSQSPLAQEQRVEIDLLRKQIGLLNNEVLLRDKEADNLRHIMEEHSVEKDNEMKIVLRKQRDLAEEINTMRDAIGVKEKRLQSLSSKQDEAEGEEEEVQQHQRDDDDLQSCGSNELLTRSITDIIELQQHQAASFIDRQSPYTAPRNLQKPFSNNQPESTTSSSTLPPHRCTQWRSDNTVSSPSDFGVVYSNYSYVIHFCDDIHEIFVWHGHLSSEPNRKHAVAKAQEIDIITDEYHKQNTTWCICTEGKEPQRLLRLLMARGRRFICRLTSSTDIWMGKLVKVGSTHVKFVEVERSRCHLRSKSVLILQKEHPVGVKTTFIWQGRMSSVWKRTAALQEAKGAVVVMDEGEEDSGFLELLNDDSVRELADVEDNPAQYIPETMLERTSHGWNPVPFDLSSLHSSCDYIIVTPISNYFILSQHTDKLQCVTTASRHLPSPLPATILRHSQKFYFETHLVSLFPLSPTSGN